MKKSILLLLGFILVFPSCNLFKKNSASTEIIGNDKKGAYLDMNYTSPETDSLIFRFDTITKEEFLKYKKNYRTKIDTSSSRIALVDSSMIIKTKDSTYTFLVDTIDYSHCAYYNGFLKPLGLFIVTDIDGNNEVGDLILIDQQTNYKYYLGSFYDDPCWPPFISPKNKFFVSISNNTYEDNACFITLVKINKNKHSFSYTGLINCEKQDWKIIDVAWINENSFVIRAITTTFLEDGQGPNENETYLKVSFGN